MEGLELLRAVRTQITEHPETHDQKLWAHRTTCGTTYCIAGWAVTLAGCEVDWLPGNGPSEAWHLAGSGQYIEDAATELLDLNEDMADDLFHERDDVRALEMLNEIIATREAEEA